MPGGAARAVVLIADICPRIGRCAHRRKYRVAPTDDVEGRKRCSSAGMHIQTSADERYLPQGAWFDLRVAIGGP